MAATGKGKAKRPEETARPVKVDGKPAKEPKHPKGKGTAGGKTEAAKRKAFPIVGMGGSAGGLEAFEQFFSRMPSDTGMAFVIIVHLDPNYKGVMPELVQRVTRMPVLQAKDGMRVEPDHVYIIPPNRNLSILHGRLQLMEPVLPRGQRMPIDFFFRSLADDSESLAAGVILSGMGTDGTLGLMAIKEKLGLTMVQDPASARYDGMPRSAIATGLVDIVAPAEGLPAKVIGYFRHAKRARGGVTPETTERATSALQKVFVLLRAKTGHDFSMYKRNMLYRRIERRMNVHQIGRMQDYVRYLQENSQEIDLLFKELLIGVTGFFRDSRAFDALKKEIREVLIANRPPGSVIRVWDAGCSTGEEAYSLAMILAECLDEVKSKGTIKVQVFATDIDKDTIEIARQGTYPVNIASDLSRERLQRFFTKEDNRYRVKKEIRDMVVFATQNLFMDPPFTKLDLLVCRNLLIYFTSELQKKLIPLFHYSLSPGGLLFLGTSETIGGFTDLFAPLDTQARVFQRRASVYASRAAPEIPHIILPALDRAGGTLKAADERLPEAFQALLVENFTPPSVLVNEAGDIIYIHGRTGKYLEPASGKVTHNIFAMAREGLRYELATAVRKAVSSKEPVVLRGISVATNGDRQILNLGVRPLREPEIFRDLVLVTFEDVSVEKKGRRRKEKPAGPGGAGGRSELEEELDRTRQRLQTIIEEMETSQEELKSANEELQSTNEELQSTNEELMTSKEELQSLNEELVTVNTELQIKNAELSEANNDLKNLLNSTEIATLFVDGGLKVKRFTSRVTQVINLIPADIGRPLSDIVTNLKYDALMDDISSVMDTLVFREKEVEGRDGSTFLMRILPYRTADNVIDGVVITFTDVTSLHTLRKELQAARVLAENIVRALRQPVVILDGDMRAVQANEAFFSTYRFREDEVKGQPFFTPGNGVWDIPELRDGLENVLPNDNRIDDLTLTADFPGIGRKVLLVNARMIAADVPTGKLILLVIEDVTDRSGRRKR
ncbi:MAG TPA: CheR family methyltransferase [Methanomicrobiales archaeon]|nr:CheR family methyltransferase [Methanomicrobiales archaeon]